MTAAGADKDGFLVKPGLAYMTCLSVGVEGVAKISMHVPLPRLRPSLTFSPLPPTLPSHYICFPR